MYSYLACFDAIAFGCLTALLARYMKLAANYGRVLRLIAGVALIAVYSSPLSGTARQERNTYRVDHC